MMEEPGEGEGVKQLEEYLKMELLELRNEIEENDLVHGIPSKGMSSLHIPKDMEYFRRERRLAIQRTLQVSDVAPLFCQMDMMLRELGACDQEEYSVRGLLLMTHQYFIDRMHALVIAKHSHLLRWKRFAVHSSTIESIYTDFKNRVQFIMDEYLDASGRAHRLATAREGYLMGNEGGLENVNREDVLIFLRWFVAHLHSLRLYMQIVRMVQWFPVAHKYDISPEVKTYKERPENPNFLRNKLMASAQPTEFSGLRRPGGSSSTPTESTSSASSVPMPPAMISAAMTGSSPLSPNAFNFGMAAAGGGIATDERTLSLPLHFNDLKLLRPHLAILCNVYSINFDVDNIRTSADEMELYANINRKFRHVFLHQEVMKTLRTYDRSELSKDKWGMDTCNHALLKEANWIEYSHMRPRHDLNTSKDMTRLRVQNNVDELLRFSASFLKLQDPEKVQDALRHHALLIQNPPVVHASAVINHRNGQATAEVWKKIYANPELYNESGGSQIMEEGQGSATKMHRRRNSYDFEATMAMLGLEETDKNQDDPSSVQGAYLSFLHLRHLKIRDVQRSCLSYLNYFRSVQRTLVINDQGLSLDGGPFDRSGQNHRTGTEYTGHQGGGGGIGAHGYLFNSPREFKINETEFMQFAEVENHDDFYFHEEGRVHVRDQIGYYIVYDVAMRDYEVLEKDLLFVATHFIEKDKEMRAQSIFKRKRTRADEGAENEGDFDISHYAHKEVDRFGVLYDIWCSECAFLECKSDLMDIYLECYQNVFDRDERRRLAQVITNLIFLRPRIDFKDKYFLLAYRLECALLRLKRNFLKKLLDRQIEEQREYLQRVWGGATEASDTPVALYGLPPRFIAKCPVAVHSDESALRPTFLLEYHPSLAIAGRIEATLQRAYFDLLNLKGPLCVLEEVQLEKRMCELLLIQFDEMDPMGASFPHNVQRDLFNGMYFEDPNNVVAVARQLMVDLDGSRQRGDKKTRQRKSLQELGRVFDLVTSRFRLMDAAWESDVLTKLYRSIAHDMGYDEFHLFMRYIQFESAKKKANADSARPPLYITSIQEDDSLLDKYMPSQLPLAISEMDETHLGRFSFRDREFVLQQLRSAGDKNLRSVLKLQITHRNALTVAVTLAHYCTRDQDTVTEASADSGAVEKSEKSTLTGMSVLSRGSASLQSPLMPAKVVSHYDAEAFFSIQLEKSPSRDRIMNEFINKTAATSALLKNQKELTALKRTLVSSFCEDFGERIYQASLRAQLIAYYTSMGAALSKMPNLRKHYFVIGEPGEKKSPEDNVSSLEEDPRVLKNRPRRLLSEDGENFLNLWFIPHYKEVLMIFKTLDDKACTRALKRSLDIVAPFHDVLHYLFAHARLGTSAARIGLDAVYDHFTTDWGGVEGIGTVLRDLQYEIDRLPEPTNVAAVSELLVARRCAMFLEFDVVVRHVLRETFLASGNVQAYETVTENIHFPLAELSDAQQPSFLALELKVPEPLEARDKAAHELFPWRSLINDSGLFILTYPPWYRIEYNLQLCLAGLRDVDRPVVHGELLALSLMLEEVVRFGAVQEAAAGDTIQFQEAADYNDIVLLGKRTTTEKMKSSRPVSRQEENDTSEFETALDTPHGMYALKKKFLLLWKRLDALKYEWGRRRLGVEHIDTVSKYRNFCKLYKSERLFHIMRSLAIQYGQGLLYDHGPMADTDMYVTPSSVPEMVVKQRQLARLVESLECTFIMDVRRRVARQLDLVLKERNREEGNLPTDLWKRPAMKETFSMRRATIAEDFIHELMSNAEETDSTITFSLEHLNQCLHNLSATVMASQKEIYENYSMYYENLLRHHHHLLYEREREVLEVREMLKAREMSTTVDVQFQLADQAHSLILEVTALRAKVAEMREHSLTMEGNIRDAVRQEYNDMVHSLFAVAFEQKSRIDEYRQHLHATTLTRIAEVRSEAAIEMGKVKEKSGAKPTAEDELSKRNLRMSQRMTRLEEYNIHLHQLMSRMRCMFTWRQSYARCDYMRRVAALQAEKNNNQKSKTRLEMISREKFHLMMEELNQVKEYLTKTEKELNQLRRKLDKELREKCEKQHASERKAASDKQLANVKQMHIDKLMEEIHEKDQVLGEMRTELDKNLKTQQTTVDKTYKEVDSLKKMLREERKLKQNAFHKVDDLLSQVYEYETAFTASRGPTGAGSRPASLAPRSRASSRPSTAVWPPAVVHPPKSLTPELRVAQREVRARPKTVSGQRLRSRIADQLLYNVEPDHHDTLVKLERQQQQTEKKEEQRV